MLSVFSGELFPNQAYNALCSRSSVSLRSTTLDCTRLYLIYKTFFYLDNTFCAVCSAKIKKNTFSDTEKPFLLPHSFLATTTTTSKFILSANNEKTMFRLLGTTLTSICSGNGSANFTTIIIPPSALLIEFTDYMNISDATRLAYNDKGGTSCDDILFPNTTWTRFIGKSGSLLANCPVPVGHCGARTPGWYSGLYPPSTGVTIGIEILVNGHHRFL